VTSGEDFAYRAEPFRHELLVHCYRMLGSVQEGEDLVQETLLRAWRARDRYDAGRASLRTWLYRIATNACLTALAGKERKVLPSGFVGPNDDPEAPFAFAHEVPWLQPFPNSLLGAEAADPARILTDRASLRLALIAALQYLPPRQRAILILRDVLDWSAAETAAALDTTTAAVNSGLQRARARLTAVAPDEDRLAEPTAPEARALLDRYIAAFEAADVAALTGLLTADAVMEMPPALNWYVGRVAYARFMDRLFVMCGTAWRMLPTIANDQPAVGAYLRDPDGVYRAHTLQVFTVTGAAISRNVVFYDSALFALFGLPASVVGK
jgi:RNA polymerase sigma-70 factor (ECF subfamily)